MAKREILLLCASSFAVMLGFGVIGPILPQFILSFGVSYTMTGLAISVFPLARMFSNFPSGILADRIGRRRPLLTGMFIIMVSALFCGLARNIYEFIVFRFFYGVGTSMFVIVANVIVADAAPPSERGKYLSYYQGSFRFGSIFGPAVGGFIAEAAGLRAPFLFLAALSSISLVSSFLLIKDSDVNRSNERTPINPKALFRLITDGRLAAIEFIQLSSFITISSIRTTMLPLYGVEFLGLPMSAIGNALSIGALASFLVLMTVSSIVDKIKRNMIIGMGFIILAASVYSYTFAQSFEAILASTVMLSVAQVLINPSKVAIIGDITSQEVRGMAMGAFRTAGDIGFFLGPSMAGYITESFGVFWPYYTVTCLCILTSAIAFYSLKASRLKKIMKMDV